MERYLKFIKRLNYVLFLGLMATLPLPRKYGHIMLIVWAVSWLLELRFTKRSNFCGWKKLFPALGLAVWVLWECLSLLWGGPESHFRDCHASLLVLPLIIAFGVNEQYHWKQAAKVLIISSLLSCFLYAFTLYWTTNVQHAWSCYCQEPYKPFQLIWFDIFLSNIKHRLFYCTILTVAIICSWMLRKDYIQRWGKVEGSIYLVLTLGILLTAIIATGSRASLFTLIILCAVYGISLLPHHHRVWSIPLITLLMVGGSVAAWQLHPRMKNVTIDQILNPVENIAEVDQQNPRGLIWHYALQTPQDYIGYGLGVCQAEQYLIDRFEQEGWNRGVFDRFHAHNQYLLICMELGIVAMLLFIAYWIYLPFCYPKKTRQRTFALCLAWLFGLNMLTDCLFSSIAGVVYICSLLVFLLTIPSSISECHYPSANI